MQKTSRIFAIALLGALLLAGGGAGAKDLVAREGSDEVRLSDEPCTDAATLAQIPPQLHGDFSKASGRMAGQDYQGCWRRAGSAAHIVWQDGDQGLVPFSVLRPAFNL